MDASRFRHASRRPVLPVLPVLPMLLPLLLACGGAPGGGDPGPANDPGAPDVPADLPRDVPTADPGDDIAPPRDVAPDPFTDPGPPDPGLPDGVLTDPGPYDFGATDVPASTCCISDAQCPAGWRCVPIHGEIGACKPRLSDGMCWMSADCGPGMLCLGATPCRCNRTDEGDGCDIPGHCIPEETGCCDHDMDCPAGQDCAPGNICAPALQPGRCWTDADCSGLQTCVDPAPCPCGFLCGVEATPGRCDPLPSACCHGDDDCQEGMVCRARVPGSTAPGSCVPDPSGPECPFDAACCWDDGDCPGGWCDGEFVCGCIDLCPMCGACMPDQIGQCRAWDVAVTIDPPEAGTCVTRPEHPAFSSFRIALAWHTSVPAKTQLEVALDFFPASTGYIPIEEDFVLDHAFDLSLSHMHFMEVPRDGDRILVRVRATDAQGGEGLSPTLAIPVDAAMAACMYPYDRGCSDGGPILCRALPPPCAEGLVMAAFAGCQRCVYPLTCTCDDGSALVCLAAEPLCEPGQVAAVRAGCWTCLNAYTCRPESSARR